MARVVLRYFRNGEVLLQAVTWRRGGCDQRGWRSSDRVRVSRRDMGATEGRCGLGLDRREDGRRVGLRGLAGPVVDREADGAGRVAGLSWRPVEPGLR